MNNLHNEVSDRSTLSMARCTLASTRCTLYANESNTMWQSSVRDLTFAHWVRMHLGSVGLDTHFATRFSNCNLALPRCTLALTRCTLVTRLLRLHLVDDKVHLVCGLHLVGNIDSENYRGWGNFHEIAHFSFLGPLWLFPLVWVGYELRVRSAETHPWPA